MDWLNQVWDIIMPWLLSLTLAYPILGKVFVVMVFVQGLCRFFLKPLMFAIAKVAKITPNLFDDRVVNSKYYRALAFFIDWFLSIKIPGAK